MKMAISPKELQGCLDVALKAAYSAGTILLNYEKKIKKLVLIDKQNEGVASKADTEAEENIVKILKKQFPSIPILAEETYFSLSKIERKKQEQTFAKSDFLWVIDPLDGTSNYLNGLNYYSVSIGLAYKGSPILGVVYRPSTAEVFLGTLGGGAFYGKKGKKLLKIKIKSNQKNLKDCLFCSGFTSTPDLEEQFYFFKKMQKKTRGLRRFGGAALDICYTALGQFDGFWQKNLAPWDMAAAALISQEAHAKVTNFQGKKFKIFDQGIVVAYAPLHKKILQELLEKF
ncbi:MAG: inositol monophosphatase [Bacteriovoracaceae bacterium]|nr:inositol monophosphatase [Bacteriovoracaceae bacterium]